MLLLIIGILLFIGLVVIHEFGHFIMARRNGVDIEEFGIGFPPKVWGRKTKGGWLFSINLLPLGGFVRMKGEHDADTAKGTFGAASLWGKTQIMAAGVVMNLIVAVVLLTGIALVGMPQLIDHQFTVKSDTKVIASEIIIGVVENGSPAARAGLERSDHLVSIGRTGDEQKLSSAKDLTKNTKLLAGQTVAITYERDGNIKHATTTIRSASEVNASLKTDKPKGYLGVVPADYTMQRSTWSAPIVALGLTKQFTILTFQGLGKALHGVGSLIAGAATGNSEARRQGQTQASSQVSGPVGIFVVLKDGSILGFQFMLLIIAVISLTLAIMNILPIPALDGGRLWLTLITAALGKKLTQEKEELVNGIGFVFLLALIALITFVDIKRFF